MKGGGALLPELRAGFNYIVQLKEPLNVELRGNFLKRYDVKF